MIRKSEIVIVYPSPLTVALILSPWVSSHYRIVLLPSDDPNDLRHTLYDRTIYHSLVTFLFYALGLGLVLLERPESH